jgi:hypothetical protein
MWVAANNNWSYKYSVYEKFLLFETLDFFSIISLLSENRWITSKVVNIFFLAQKKWYFLKLNPILNNSVD